MFKILKSNLLKEECRLGWVVGGGSRLGGGEKGWNMKSRRQQHSVLRSHLGQSQSLPLWPNSDQHWPCNTPSLLQPKIVFCTEASKLAPLSYRIPVNPGFSPWSPSPTNPTLASGTQLSVPFPVRPLGFHI